MAISTFFKKALMVATGATAIALGTINSAQASNLVSGTIVKNENGTTSIDYWDFSVVEAGETRFDVDGEWLQFSAFIGYFFRNDGSLDRNDLVTDHFQTTVATDTGYINYISAFLELGDYTLAISDTYFTVEDAVAGEKNSSFLGIGPGGDYQTTFSDNVRLASSQSVPEPASMLGLVAVSATGAASLKRKLAKAKESRKS